MSWCCGKSSKIADTSSNNNHPVVNTSSPLSLKHGIGSPRLNQDLNNYMHTAVGQQYVNTLGKKHEEIAELKNKLEHMKEKVRKIEIEKDLSYEENKKVHAELQSKQAELNEHNSILVSLRESEDSLIEQRSKKKNELLKIVEKTQVAFGQYANAKDEALIIEAKIALQAALDEISIFANMLHPGRPHSSHHSRSHSHHHRPYTPTHSGRAQTPKHSHHHHHHHHHSKHGHSHSIELPPAPMLVGNYTEEKYKTPLKISVVDENEGFVAPVANS